MKKMKLTSLIFLTLCLIPYTLFSQLSNDYNEGYKAGYKEGYCHNDFGCIAPPCVPGVPSPGNSSYKGGYNDGFSNGIKDKAAKNNKASSPNYSYSNSSIKSPNTTSTVNYNQMANQLSSQFQNVADEREKRKAEDRYFYQQSTNFVNTYTCSGMSSQLNKMVLDAQNMANLNINLFFNYLTSGIMEREDYKMETVICVNNFTSFINQIDNLNKEIGRKYSTFEKTQTIGVAESFISTLDQSLKKYRLKNSYEWYQKTRRYQNLSYQKIDIIQTAENSSEKTLSNQSFYTSVFSLISDFKMENDPVGNSNSQLNDNQNLNYAIPRTYLDTLSKYKNDSLQSLSEINPRKNPILGHWSTESGATQYFISSDKIIMVDNGNRSELTYYIIESSSNKKYFKINVTLTRTGKGHIKELELASDNKRLKQSICTNYGCNDSFWNYVDDKQEP
jgi:hypothetical protein